jgi:hypothetical protein
MKLIWLVVSIIILLHDQTPFKPKEEFELKLDLQFKQRPRPDVNTVELEKRPAPSSMLAPYLYINLKVLKAIPEEVRIKVTKNNDDILLSRKFDPNLIVKLDLGFTDDVKDRVSAHQYVIMFHSKDKKPLSKIEIFFEKDGTYLVNGEKRGRL